MDNRSIDKRWFALLAIAAGVLVYLVALTLTRSSDDDASEAPPIPLAPSR